ncbi:MAG: MFS transporter, partial [Vicinamibacterales bacterium]
MTAVAWVICVISAIGFAFDSYELLMLPLIVRPAISEMLGVPIGHPSVNNWVGILFNVPAIAGGIFGLLGGYLTDVFGRRRVLVWSILLYAFSALAAAFSTSVGWLLFWRCGVFVGVCVEFVAAVAWLSELFQDPKQRESVIGWTQAFGSLGGLMVTSVYAFLVSHADQLPAVAGSHSPWRYTLISGVIPAIPLLLSRPFLPESPGGRQKKEAGTLKRPSFGELFQPAFRRTTIVTTIMMACAYAAAFGAIQQMPGIVPGLAEVRDLARPAQQQAVAGVQLFQEYGGLAGRIALAVLAVRILSQRTLLRVFQFPGLLVMPLVFLVLASSIVTALSWGIFARGFLTIAQ